MRPLFSPVNNGPESALSNKAGLQMVLFNNFYHSSWLLAAASLQGLITWLFPTVLTFLPALLILGYRVLDVLLMTYGLRPNRYLEGTVRGKVTAQMPDERGDFGETPARETVVVLLLGIRSNHPLGILYPSFKEVNEYFLDMTKDLESNREDYGYLTTTSWISTSDPTRPAASELLNIYYFRSITGLHKFAHNPSHRAGVTWWNKTIKQHRDISIMHEVYEAGPGAWENIYENYWRAGFASIKFPVTSGAEVDADTDEQATAGQEDESNEKKLQTRTQWISPLVDASRGNLNTAAKRMGRV